MPLVVNSLAACCLHAYNVAFERERARAREREREREREKEREREREREKEMKRERAHPRRPTRCRAVWKGS